METINQPIGMENKDEGLRKMINLYLDFAVAIREKTGLSLRQTLSWFTPLKKRFQDCVPDPDGAVFQEYLDGIEKSDLLLADYTYRFYLKRREAGGKFPKREDPGVIGLTAESCFSFEIEKDKPEVVDLHFSNKEKGAAGPLSKERLEARRAELKEIFRTIKNKYPEIKTVKGGSWLYNLEAYRRLFPASYVASAKPITHEEFSGYGLWGQFLDSDSNVKQELIDKLFQKLPEVDAKHIADAFPYHLLLVSAPIENFYKEYGIG